MSNEMDLARCLQYCRPYCQWNLNGNTLAGLEWMDSSPEPTQDELDAAWTQLQSVKIWSNAQAFMAEFTMDEKGAMSISTDSTLAALRLELSTWFSTVHSNDSRVVMGLDKMVELGIISEQRKQEIITLSN